MIKPGMMVFWGLVIFLWAPVFSWGSERPEDRVENESVILLHGILNTPLFMKKIEGALSREGYHVLNIGYPSRDKTIEQHAKDLEPLVRSVPKGNVIHFVGFSLGSQVIRYYLNHFPVSRPGRFVMIAPPNHGSELADYFYRFEWFPWLYGTESGPQLKASNREFFESLGKPPLPFGIIAGGRGNKTGRSPFLPGDDDGTVSVESARLEGAEDFVLIDHDHTALLISEKTVSQTLVFLKSGCFIHSSEDPVRAGSDPGPFPCEGHPPDP